MSRESERSFRWQGELNREHGGWLRGGGNKPDIWPKGTRSSIRPSARPGDAVGEFHTYPNTGSRWTQSHSRADMSSTFQKSFAISRGGVYLHNAGAPTDAFFVNTNRYLTTFTYNTFYFGH